MQNSTKPFRHTEHHDADAKATEEDAKATIGKLEQLTREKVDALAGDRGAVARALADFRKNPRAEISQDWHAVRDLASRAAKHLGETSADEHDLHVLASVNAYLECARTERDFAEAWSLVNMADALLPLVVPDDDLRECTVRLRVADDRMEDTYREILGHTLDAADDGVGRALAEMLKDHHHRDKAAEMFKLLGPGAAAAAPALRRLLTGGDARAREAASKALEQAGLDPSAVQGAEPDERNRLHVEQLARALIWNMMNRHVSLKLALWRTILWQLVAGVVAGLAGIAVVRYPGTIGFGLGLRDPLAVLLFGFFGGTLSAFLTARDAVVEIPSYQLIKTYTWLRMTLGAAGALVVYIVANSLGSDAVQKALQARSYGFMATAIAAGFSERLFVGAIEKAAENLHLTGTTKKAAKNKQAQAAGASPRSAKLP